MTLQSLTDERRLTDSVVDDMKRTRLTDSVVTLYLNKMIRLYIDFKRQSGRRMWVPGDEEGGVGDGGAVNWPIGQQMCVWRGM